VIKVFRLRRAADEWGDYKVPIEQRKYVPFKGRGEPTTVPDLHARVEECYKAVDYQLFDHNYIRWVRGDDVPNLGKKPEKRFPSLSRIYSEKFHAARTAEGLNSQRETVEFLLAEYERFPPGFPGGYSALRLEYPVHLEALSREATSGKRTVSVWMRDGYPNRFLERRGVKNPPSLRKAWGAYAARKLAPLDEQYASELTVLLRKRGADVGRDPDARAIARTLRPYLMASATSPAPDLTLAGAYEGALKRSGLEINGQRRLLEQLDYGGPR
jgi:hypothetical protein